MPALPLADLLATAPEIHAVPIAELQARVRSGPCVVVLDDDPTGTQSIADLPVLTTWSIDDLRWALSQPANAFFVLTNTRSLSEADAAERNRRVARNLVEAARAEHVDFVIASRGDSTLRGHYPLETDVLADVVPADGVVIVPAYFEAGRVTVDSVHWLRTAEGMLPVGESEFAKDATFGYENSDLRSWVEEKTAGRIPAGEVKAITLTDLRTGGVEHVTGLLRQLRAGQPIVVDAACDDDLRVLTLAVIAAESAGAKLIYRVGPSFVRARVGQEARPPLTPQRNSGGHGLIAVGSHVAVTTRQLAGLRELGGITEFELEVTALLDPDARDEHIAEIANKAAKALQANEVVIGTSRTVVTAADPDASLAISRSVSAALVETVARTVGAQQPAFVVAKGGITSSDIATESLGIRRAIARGTLLPGIVSLWEPVDGDFEGIPYIVFAGNVGDDNSLADVVAKLR
jgi:uncharacterized protein YgbK (DUF1537 family)